MNDETDKPDDKPPLTFWQMLGSTVSAALGVQSSANRERDFSRGKASHFILMGIGFTVVFVLLVALVVKVVLSQVSA
ncbi:MAG: DUF2970 domain-containing protein [Pseudomonadales bacterium]